MHVALMVAGCAPMLGAPDVSYGLAQPIPLVQPSTDTRRWYVPMTTEALGPVVWFVDTGYTFSTCDDDLVDALDLVPKGRVRIRGELGRVRASKVRLPPMELGGHEIEDLVCQVRDLGSTSSLDDPDEVPIAGVIGMDLLRRFRLGFDPHDGEMSLADPRSVAPLPRQGDGISALRRTGQRVRMSLDVGEERVWLIVDTGATNTYLDGTRIGLEPTTTQHNVTVRGTGAGEHDVGRALQGLTDAREARRAARHQCRASGGEEAAQLSLRRARADVREARNTVRDARAPPTPRQRVIRSYELAEIRLGSREIGPVSLTERHRRWWVPGLLGLDLLNRFEQDYDFARGRIALTPTRPRPLPQFSAFWPPPEEEPLPSRLLDEPTDALSDPDPAGTLPSQH